MGLPELPESPRNNNAKMGSPKCLLGIGPQHHLSVGLAEGERRLESPHHYRSLGAAGASLLGSLDITHTCWVAAASFLGSLCMFILLRTALERQLWSRREHHHHLDRREDICCGGGVGAPKNIVCRRHTAVTTHKTQEYAEE